MEILSNSFSFFVTGVLLILYKRVSSIASPVTPPPGQGYPIFDDCVAYHKYGCSNQDSPTEFFIKARNEAGYETGSDICTTESECSGTGWTFIGTFEDSDNDTSWSYDSDLWTAKGDNQTILNSQFWSANVTEICLVSDAFNIQFPVSAPSLRSLFFEKRILDIESANWTMALTPSAEMIGVQFQLGCYEAGFNVGNTTEYAARARIGIVSIDGDSCPDRNTTINAIGVGLSIPGEEGSVHGVVSGSPGSLSTFRRDVSVHVRSRPVDEDAE